jgi:ADP-heptose:LPS heptosyltransferase/GT2 family glycosyltransferase
MTPGVARPAAPADLDPMLLALEEARLDAAGVLHVRGWVVCWQPLQSVEVLLGTVSLGFADTMLSRQDVAAEHGRYPDAALAGFALAMRAAPSDEASSLVTVIATDSTGDTRNAALELAAAHGPAAPPSPMQAMLEEARVNELGVLRVRGWAVSLSPVEHVRVFLDDEVIGTAETNLPREDVGFTHPEYPDAARSGFLLQHMTEADIPAGHSVRVQVTAVGGIERELVAPLLIAPVVRRRPRIAEDVQVHCDALSLSADGILFIRGWALCGSGTADIDVDLGEQRLGQAELGQDRPDVGNAFPAFPGARSAGFRFRGRAAGSWHGEHVARVTVHGKDGETRSVLLPVLASPADTDTAVPAPRTLAPGINCYLDTPRRKAGQLAEPVRGFLSLNGWAFSRAGLTGIEVFVDGRSQGQAHRGIRREDLHAAMGEKEALRAGFAMLIPPQVLKRGRHDIRIVIRDAAGETEAITFAVDSDPSLEGPGPWTLRRKLTDAEIGLHRAVVESRGAQPHFSLLLPCDPSSATQRKRLRATLESLRHQAWPHWQMVLAVPAGADLPDDLFAGLEELAPHVRVVASAPKTQLATLASGAGTPLLVLLAPGDELGEDALLELAIEASLVAGADFLYADERRIDPADGQARAFFKPDFSPDLLLATNYIGRPFAAAPSLLARIDARLADLAGHGEYDLVLRLTEAAARIVHVPKVLCERAARALDTPTQERRAICRALERRAIDGAVEAGCIPGTWRVRRTVAVQELASIIIPTAAARGLVRTAVESIRARTRYPHVEIVVIDNIPASHADAAAWHAWVDDAADVVVRIDEPFNWSRLNNLAARAARGAFLLFLNDDIEVLEPGWLDALLEQAQRPEVGAVGPLLLYPDGTVQHAGMFLSGGVGRHAFRFSGGDEPGPFGLIQTPRNVLAVTGACLLTRRDVFDGLGGFDEQHAVVNNDVDYCLRVRAAGRLVIYTPHARLTHHEMASRAPLSDSYDEARFRTAWADVFATGDPYFSPHLAPDVDDFVAEQEPLTVLHVGRPVVSRASVRRVLAVKVDHIGDFITALPAFRRIKQQFPNAELTVLAASAAAALAPLEPAIDRLLTFDFFHARSQAGQRALTKRDFAQLAQRLTPFGFDLALDLRRQPETRMLLQHSGARWLAGFDRDEQMKFLDIAVAWEGDLARTHKRAHISEALVAFVDAVAGSCDPDRRMVVTPPPSREQARAHAAALTALQLASSAPLVAIHAGAGAENKQWPVGNFAALADLLTGEAAAQVVVIGGPEDAALAEELRSLLRRPEHVLSLVGRLTLAELPVLLGACDLYVGNDSGPKHIAAALGVPTIGIHGGSVDAVEWGPLGPAAVALRRAMTCSPCYLALASDCHRGLACLHGIRVGDVWRVARRMLALRSPAVERDGCAK